MYYLVYGIEGDVEWPLVTTVRESYDVKERVTMKYVVTRGIHRDADRMQNEMEEMFR